MSIGTILYWVGFVIVCIAWAVYAWVILFGGGDGLGYTRNSVESTPTDKDGRH